VLYCRAGFLDVCCIVECEKRSIVIATSGNPSSVAPRRKMNGKECRRMRSWRGIQASSHSVGGEIFKIATRQPMFESEHSVYIPAIHYSVIEANCCEALSVPSQVLYWSV
jgi:hypothetical protein